jgi:uncharacterized protein with PQ loop repeat
MIALIPIVFYSYTSITGESIFAIDIATFIVAVVVGQIMSYTLFMKKQFSGNTDKIALAILIVLGIAFIVFTFYPPHLPIFQDPVSGGYGNRYIGQNMTVNFRMSKALSKTGQINL